MALTLLVPCPVLATSKETGPKPVVLLPGSGQFVALDSWRGAALYRLRDGSVVHRFRAGGLVNAMAVTADETVLLLGCDDGSLGAWELATGALLWERLGGDDIPGFVTDASFAGDGRSVVVCDIQGQALVYETQTGRKLGGVRLPPWERSFVSAALSPDGSRGVLVDTAGRLSAFDVATGGLEDTKVHAWRPVRYSVDGKCIAVAAGNDGLDHLRLVHTDGSWFVRDLGEFVAIGHIKPTADGGFLATAQLRGDNALPRVPDFVVGVQYRPATSQLEEIWRIKDRGSHRAAMDFAAGDPIGICTDYRLVTETISLPTGEVLQTVDNRRDRFPDLATQVFLFAQKPGAPRLVVVALVAVVLLATAAVWRVILRPFWSKPATPPDSLQKTEPN
jgi:WD40 repeat protein